MNEDTILQQEVQTALNNIPQKIVLEFAKRLFPIQSSSNPYICTYNNLKDYYNIQLRRKTQFQHIIQDVLHFAKDINNELYSQLNKLYQNGFELRLKNVIQVEDINIQKNQQHQIHNNTIINNIQYTSFENNSIINQNNYQKRNCDNVEKNVSIQKSKNKIDSIPAIKIDCKPIIRPNSIIKDLTCNMIATTSNNPIKITNNNNLTLNKLDDPLSSSKSPFDTTSKINNNYRINGQCMTGQIRQQNIVQKYISDTIIVQNLVDKYNCLCGKKINELTLQIKQFNCIHCGYNYHYQCFQKKLNQNYCSYCHLKMIIPTRQVKKILFIGYLKKNKKKHQINFYLNSQDIDHRSYKIQIRCFRIKQNTQNYVLFPDSSSFSINGLFLKQFTPLHRQSSLKYRKDQPFILQNYRPKDNKIIITERLAGKDSKQDRIQTENHLLGIYLVEELKVQNIVKQLKLCKELTFFQSHQLLNSCFSLDTQTQITCEVVKIPLTCTLTTQKISMPVRGLFCTHYQCFDFKNFLMLTSQSANPRWLCPLCRQPTYQFRLDCIISAILEEYKKSGATQVMFFKTGQFTVYAKDQICKDKVTSIDKLNIENRYKRQAQNEFEDEDKKLKKKIKNTIPQDTEIINLSD